MAALITTLFFVLFLVFCAALAAIVRPSLLKVKTRKEAAQAAGGCLIILLILSPFLPDNSPTEQQPLADKQDTVVHDGPFPLPICEDIPGRMKRLECEYQRALEAYQTSDINLEAIS